MSEDEAAGTLFDDDEEDVVSACAQASDGKDLFGDAEGVAEGDDVTEQGSRGALAHIPSSSDAKVVLQLPRRQRPAAKRKLALVRLPTTVKVNPQPFDRAREAQREQRYINRPKNKPPPIDSYLPDPLTVRWRVKRDGHGNVIKDTEGKPERESNSYLVRWDDNTLSLFVGDAAFEGQTQPEKVHLFEDTEADTHALHAVVAERMVFRSYAFNPANARSALQRGQQSKRQKTQLTTASSAWQEDRNTRDRLAQQRDKEEVQRRQKESGRNRGLTAQFLEDESDEDDSQDEGDLSKIKQHYSTPKRKR